MEDTKKATQEAAEKEKNNNAKVENFLETAKQIGNGNVSLSPSLENADTHTNNGVNFAPLDYQQICKANYDSLTRLYVVLNYAENGGIVDELPTYGLPPHLQAYINHVTDVYQCPREFPTVALFSAISTAVGKKNIDQ